MRLAEFAISFGHYRNSNFLNNWKQIITRITDVKSLVNIFHTLKFHYEIQISMLLKISGDKGDK